MTPILWSVDKAEDLRGGPFFSSPGLDGRGFSFARAGLLVAMSWRH